MVNSESICRCQRFNVVGTSGSGKTNFARALAQRLQLPCHEMDQLFWKPNWQESSDEDLMAKVAEVTSGSKWVLDGNYTRTTPVKWKQVQVVIWLDLPFARTVFRVARRAVKRSFTAEEIWPGTGNRESLTKTFFSRDSIVLWAIQTHRANRKKYLAMMNAPEYASISFVRLCTPDEVTAFVERLRPSAVR